jgi:hypothetical protein
MKAFEKKRLREALDIGEVIRCPDARRPESCEECGLKENGTHWAYCSHFIDDEDQSEADGPPASPAVSSDES